MIVQLKMKNGPLAGQIRHYEMNAVSIGRQAESDLLIPLPTVSSRHARLYRQEETWFFEDLQSSNGSRVRKKDGTEFSLTGRKRQPVAVDTGDTLWIDECEMDLTIVVEADRWSATDMTVLGAQDYADLENSAKLSQPDLDRVLKMLHRFMRMVAMADDEQAVMKGMLRFAARLSNDARHAMWIEFMGWEEPQARMAVNAQDEELSVETLGFSRTVVQQVVEKQQGLLFSDAAREVSSSSVRELNIHSLMAVPFWFGERVGGVVLVESDDQKAVFTPSSLQALMFFVYHASVAVNQLRLIRELNQAFISSVKTLLRALDMRDPHTSAHSLKVQSIALEIANGMNLPPERIEVVRYAALLHDIGKIAIPDEILCGKDKLTDEQRQLMNQHPKFTGELLKLIDFPSHLQDVAAVAAAHHERLDGKGPLGLTGDDIPLEARILAVADVFEALTATRSYKEIKRASKSFGILREMAGAHLDPNVINALEKITTL